MRLAPKATAAQYEVTYGQLSAHSSTPASGTLHPHPVPLPTSPLVPYRTKDTFLAHSLAVTVCRLFALEAYIAINRILLSRHLCTKPKPLFVVLLLAVSSSRCASVQSGPRLSTNTPTFFFSHSRCTKRVHRFLSCRHANLARPPSGNKSSLSLRVYPLKIYY